MRIDYIKLGLSHMHLTENFLIWYDASHMRSTADVHKAAIAFIWLRTCEIAASMAQKHAMHCWATVCEANSWIFATVI